uniref:hypothetical protein n=1 Tax=Acetatifactor sp. TaxID=1872090 RepID=UPI004056462D
MKKKVISILIVTSLLLTACGSSERVITGDVASDNTQTEAANQADGAQVEENVADANAEQAATGYVYKAQNVLIEIDAEAAPYIEALGEPASYYEATSCAFDDLDKFYTYNGFEIDTYSIDGVDYVLTVALLDDSVTTQEGLCIGDSVDKMKETYGEPTTETETSAVYVKGNMKLSFILADGVITSIEYVSTVLD